MSEQENGLTLLAEGLAAIITPIIRDAVREAINGQNSEEDRLLDAEAVAKLLGVSEDWLYRNSKRLPFARKLGPKMLRFSSLGIQKYLATRKIP